MQEKVISIEKNLNNTFYMYWILTDFCNQHCHYCPKNLNSGNYSLGNTPGFPTLSEIEHFIQSIISIVTNKNKRIKLTISGGEPTTHFYLPNLISTFKPHGTVAIVTNGTSSLSWWKKLSDLPHGVVISLHPEYYDKKKIRINDLADFLIANGVGVQLNLMCDPSRWSAVLDIVSDIDANLKPFIKPKVMQNLHTGDRKVLEYTHEQLDFIKTYETKIPWWIEGETSVYTLADGTKHTLNIPVFQAKGMDKFFGWRCAAGRDAISISPNGKVYAGICANQELGTLTSFEILQDYTYCLKSTCACPADIVLNKYKMQSTSRANAIKTFCS